MKSYRLEVDFGYYHSRAVFKAENDASAIERARQQMAATHSDYQLVPYASTIGHVVRLTDWPVTRRISTWSAIQIMGV